MNVPIQLDPNYLPPDVSPDEIYGWQDRIDHAGVLLTEGAGAGAAFRGWMEPSRLMPPFGLNVASDQSSPSVPLSPEKRVTSPALLPKFVE